MVSTKLDAQRTGEQPQAPPGTNPDRELAGLHAEGSHTSNTRGMYTRGPVLAGCSLRTKEEARERKRREEPRRLQNSPAGSGALQLPQ